MNLNIQYCIYHQELIFKEILNREHWSLIFDDANKVNKELLVNGDFQSVTFDKAITRIEGIKGVKFSEEIKFIKEIKKIRNKTEHFQFKGYSAAIKYNVSQALSEIIKIINEFLEIDDETKAGRIYKRILKKSSTFKEFTQLTLEKLKPQLKEFSEDNICIIDCPECFQKTMPLDSDFKCLFCGYSDESENVMDKYIENILDINLYSHIKDGGDNISQECFDCGDEKLVLSGDKYICFNCYNEWDMDDIGYCNDCQRPYKLQKFISNEIGEEEHGLGICDECAKNRWNRYE